MAAEQTDALGRRVSCGEHRATVRFVGGVPPTAGVWLGVEWDEPARGKHDGCHEGVRYFTCRHPTGGSFVRPSKVSFGVDFLSAVRREYASEGDAADAEISISGRTLEWARVPERSLESLPSILLQNCQVNGPGEDGQILRTTPNVRWLDLSGSLLRRWEDVAAIAGQLPRLEALQLSFNRLALPSDPEAHRRAFRNLKVLTLIGCELTWTQILRCAPMWPMLEELTVEDNDIERLRSPEGVLRELRCLNVSKNRLDQDSLLSLAALPRLEQLIMSDTGFSAVHFPDAAPGAQTSMFASLEKLNLNRNQISEWGVIDELSKLPSLRQLWCRGNPLASADRNPRTANQMLVAKLPHLLVLNGSDVTPQERRGAECDYLKMFGEEWLRAGGRSQTSREFADRHPRYRSLVDKYGAPEEGELTKRQPFALKNQLLKITFVFADDAARTPLEKKLPASMEVQKVKGLLSRLLKVPATDLKLSYTSAKVLGPEYQMDSDLKTLFFYAVEDGDTILVRRS
ncbi:tubulin-specific chaperone E [Hippocampus comes]|uniref:tubulin-specific chaperone E n=1 Tax=Hippocampus comes TaxID=109280 RepID=UPI00094E879B|nr:PREDICTED: tubulin-specific chaperone E [Hippocampus comes]